MARSSSRAGAAATPPSSSPPSSPSNTPNDPSALAASNRSAESSNALPLPHELDQAVGQVKRPPDPVIEQAHADLQQGQVDTDMRATPGLDAARRERMVDTPQPQRTVGKRPQQVAPTADRRRAPRAPR